MYYSCWVVPMWGRRIRICSVLEVVDWNSLSVIRFVEALLSVNKMALCSVTTKIKLCVRACVCSHTPSLCSV
jgi:hypothetical protein